MTKFKQPDPAAIFAAAMSLYQLNSREDCDTSDAFDGHDQFMRRCMDVAVAFETWALSHVDFGELSDLWPYLLHDHFLAAIEALTGPMSGDNLTALENVRDVHFPRILENLLKHQPL